MAENDISARLRALATDEKRRPETARLRDIFEQIEATLRAGVPQADVLAELHLAGFKMTMASFKSALQRIRKERVGVANQQRPPPAGSAGRKEHTTGISEEAQQARITNPADIRRARSREIKLDELSDQE